MNDDENEDTSINLEDILEKTLDQTKSDDSESERGIITSQEAEIILQEKEDFINHSTIIFNKIKERELDYKFARRNLKEIIKTSKSSLEELAEVARQSQHPRAYEVVASLMNSLVDANAKLLDLHRQKQDIEIKEKNQETKSQQETKTKSLTQNNLFVGSSSQLLEFAKQFNKNITLAKEDIEVSEEVIELKK